MLIMFVLCCKTWNVTKPGAWLARPSSRGSTISRFLPLLISGAAGLPLTAGSHSQSGQYPVRLEARSEACSALSLKPKQRYSFNFPDICLEMKLLDHVTIQYLNFLRSYHTVFHSGCIITSPCRQSRYCVDSLYSLSVCWGL